MPLITTPGASNADSYASVAEADLFNGTNLYASGWQTAVQADKENALRMATRGLDDMPAAWTGKPSVPAVQALGWPRIGMRNRNDFGIATNAIPTDLKNATSEYARLILENDLLSESSASATADSGIQSVDAGGVRVTFKSKDKKEEKTGGWDQADARMASVPSSVIALLVKSWLLDPRDIEVPYTGLVAEVL